MSLFFSSCPSQVGLMNMSNGMGDMSDGMGSMSKGIGMPHGSPMPPYTGHLSGSRLQIYIDASLLLPHMHLHQGQQTVTCVRSDG